MKKAFIPSIKGFLFEKEKQPWGYIFDYWFLSASRRYTKSRYYLEQNKLPGISLQGNIIIINNKVIDISDAPDGERCLIAIIAEYFDFIYPKLVTHSIPFFISEGPYEKEQCKVQGGDVIIDAGANLGLFSWLFLDTVGKNGHIYMFEPVPSLSKLLTESIEINKTKEEMTVIEAALSNKDGVTSFLIEDYTGGSHESSNGDTLIKTSTIDSFVANNSISKINFIKADIEGMEPQLIDGAKETIKRDKPKIAICTYHNPNHRAELKYKLETLRPDYKFAYSSHKLFAW